MPPENEPILETEQVNQTATDPRLEQTQDDPPVLDSEENTETLGTPVSADPPAKPKKTTEEVLKSRIGHITKTLSQKDQEVQAAIARAEAAEALLAASARTTPEEGQPPPVVLPGGPKTYSEADFQAAVTAKAEADAFNAKADDMYNDGAEKFPDWKDSVDTLVASGFMNKDLLDAAMAVEDGSAVLHHLGMNLDEAERINALPPIRKAAEMTKLSLQLAVPKNTPVSNAPAPIRPVNGSPNPVIDLKRVADESDDMSAWVAARKKQGSRWAQR